MVSLKDRLWPDCTNSKSLEAAIKKHSLHSDYMSKIMLDDERMMIRGLRAAGAKVEVATAKPPASTAAVRNGVQ